MKKRAVAIAVLAVFFLVAATFVGAKALYETKSVPKGERHTISEIVPSKAKWEKVVKGDGGFMEGINFDRKGNIWMVSPMSGELLTVKWDKVHQVKKYPGPVGAKFHKDGRLFITDITGVIHAYDPKTGKSETAVSTYKGQPFNGLNDLVFDKDGGLYFTEPMGSSAINPVGRVFYLPANSKEPVLFADKIAYPNGVALSADGNRVYVSEFGKNRVLSVPAKNAPPSPETPFVFGQYEGGIGPDGLAVDTEGNLYIAHFQAGQIVVQDKDGFKYGTIRLPEGAGTFTTNLAFHDGYLYITESSKNEVWRIKVLKKGLVPYGLQ
ncbi:SMP-30/gluconolactonase/LRE family protein [Planococcus sp. N028]|uniref:SMP-30/gluconolactonase/LRE family protein n=1 Tax=Planococcus shixiaomingii TaxID=3058393 RepID=A0ABT8MZP1_9BACL|nr:SMP-30/gluconolactonase/LRE family protein [Planococcus sp. N028]MDN7240938.1 SMP-30/gluconolactonase/LRE family protein [Planococcus sp. N028]